MSFGAAMALSPLPELSCFRLKTVRVDEISDAVASYHDVEAKSYAKFRSQSPGRDMAAWLCRKWTGATLRELGSHFGLSGIDKRVKFSATSRKKHAESRKWKQAAREMESTLALNTEHNVVG